MATIKTINDFIRIGVFISLLAPITVSFSSCSKEESFENPNSTVSESKDKKGNGQTTPEIMEFSNVTSRTIVPDNSNYEQVDVINTNIITSQYYSASNFLHDEGSRMYYYPELFNEQTGGHYVLEYNDIGGSGMDSYPNLSIGSVKANGTYYASSANKVGMPIQLRNIPSSFNFIFTTSQENARDDNDKWMASINFIFDIYGSKTSEPDRSRRDYDLVVMHSSHNFGSENLSDLPVSSGSSRHWYFARNEDNSLKPYQIKINGITHQYAVRYKFFTGNDSKSDKAHVKFIPFTDGRLASESELPEIMKINVKDIIKASRDYIEFANIPNEYRELALEKIAQPNTWLKAINAGYEVYTGNSILMIDEFNVEF